MRNLIILLLCFSCASKQEKLVATENTIDTAVLKVDEVQKVDKVQTFWQQFRESVLTNDTTKLISLIEFPISTRGPQDSDPIIKYQQNEFINVFSDFLSRSTGTNIEDLNESQIDLIRKTKTVDTEKGEIQGFRIGDMEFQKVQDEWRLVFIYYWKIER